ncbi:MAG: acyloxyacyl hydrolase [Deltaproteobacteria bacterium]|nr:acyloxyacyl hydrolase [Deltaproteobacteria bacterium]
METDLPYRRFLRIPAILIPLLLFFVPGIASGAGNAEDRQTRVRLLDESIVMTGFGTGHLTEGRYETIFFIWQLAADLNKIIPPLKNHRGRLYAYLEPQINPVRAPDEDFEFGIGIGLKYTYPLAERLCVYILASTGPHYVSVVTVDQANGFLFSDTVGAGLNIYITKRSALNIGYRFRHISNAGLVHPNGGIDSNFATIGYSILF